MQSLYTYVCVYICIYTSVYTHIIRDDRVYMEPPRRPVKLTAAARELAPPLVPARANRPMRRLLTYFTPSIIMRDAAVCCLRFFFHFLGGEGADLDRRLRRREIGRFSGHGILEVL